MIEFKLDIQSSNIQNSRLSNYHKQFFKKVYKDAESAYDHLSEFLLTEDEKFALAILSGVPYKLEKTKEGNYKYITEPCIIKLVNSTWHIYRK